MTDLEAIEYLEELKKYNVIGKMLTPANHNKGYDPFYQGALSHAIRALQERTGNRDRKEKIDE